MVSYGRLKIIKFRDEHLSLKTFLQPLSKTSTTVCLFAVGFTAGGVRGLFPLCFSSISVVLKAFLVAC